MDNTSTRAYLALHQRRGARTTPGTRNGRHELFTAGWASGTLEASYNGANPNIEMTPPASTGRLAPGRRAGSPTRGRETHILGENMAARRGDGPGAAQVRATTVREAARPKDRRWWFGDNNRGCHKMLKIWFAHKRHLPRCPPRRAQPVSETSRVTPHPGHTSAMVPGRSLACTPSHSNVT